MRSKLLAFGVIGFFLCGFTNRHFTGFYDVYVQDVVNVLTGTTPSPGFSGVQKFNNQYFTLWTSPVASEQNDLPTYYKQIVTFCTAHNIRKVIWYFGYTSASAPFYNPQSTDPASFVQLLQSHPLPPETQIEFRIECASMAQDCVYTGGTLTPTSAPIPPSHVTLPNYMSDISTIPPAPSNGFLYNGLWWARDMFNNILDVTLISGVTIDPQNNCTSDLLPYTRASDANQAIVNYLDEFASINSDFYPLERGITFDGSAKVQIFGNRAAIPITDTLLISDTDTIVNFYNGSTGPKTAPWVRPDPAAPFIDNMYPQLYNLEAPFIYTIPNEPQQSGLKFLQLLSLTPYCPGFTTEGALSTISFSTGSTTITGTGTQFLSEIPQDPDTSVNTTSPIGFFDSGGTQQCVFPNNDPHYPGTPTSVACTGKVHSVTDNTHLTLNTTPMTNQTNVPWLYVENIINYREYYLTPAMVSGIFLMFSGEGSFFGQWTLDQFMNFVIAFYNQGQTYSLYYEPSEPSIPIPNQFAIFTYEQITGRAPSPPPIVWFPGE